MHAKIARLGLGTSTAKTNRPIGTKTTLALGCVALRHAPVAQQPLPTKFGIKGVTATYYTLHYIT